MDAAEKGQVPRSAADVYEEFFVPALFQEWVRPVSEAAGVSPGQRVLDVACGTGVLTRDVQERVGPDGEVAGLDRNEGMLEVARRKSPGIEWKLGQAENIPYSGDSFNTVVSQFGLMFFEDRKASLKEMWRVLKPGGRLAIAVWDTLQNNSGYAVMTALLRRLFGDDAAKALEAPYNLGPTDALLPLFAEAGLPDAQVQTLAGTTQFPSIDAWVHTDVKGWTLADMIDEAQYQLLRKEAVVALKEFQLGDGTVAFPSSAHIITVAKF